MKNYKCIEAAGTREVHFTYTVLKVYGGLYLVFVLFLLFGCILILMDGFSVSILVFSIMILFIGLLIGAIFFVPYFRVGRSRDAVTIVKRDSFFRKSSFSMGPSSFPMLQGRDIKLVSRFFERKTGSRFRRFEPRIQYIEGNKIKHVTLLPIWYLINRSEALLLTKDDLREISVFLDLELVDSDEMGGSLTDQISSIVNP